MIIAFFTTAVVIAVVVWVLNGKEEVPPVQLRVMTQAEKDGKRLVVFRVGLTDKRGVQVDGIYLSRGPGLEPSRIGFYPHPADSPNDWRPAMVDSSGIPGTFVGEREFGVFAPVDWPVWRLHATASVQLKSPIRNGKEKLGMLWTRLKHDGVRSGAIDEILRAEFLSHLQVLVSDPITNTVLIPAPD